MSTAPVKSHHQSQPHHPQPPQQHQQPHQPLHNFSLPSFLNWNSSNGSSRVRREPYPPRAPASPLKRTDGGEHTEGDVDPKKEGLDGECSAEGDDGRKPWNLRPRRAGPGMAAAGAGVRNGERDNRPRRNGEGGYQKHEKEEEEGKKKKRRRLWVALTKEEIEEDVFIMTGFRPSRRPKKRMCISGDVVGGHDDRGTPEGFAAHHELPHVGRPAYGNVHCFHFVERSANCVFCFSLSL